MPVIEGGTGDITLTNHGVLVGAGTTAITQLAVGTTGQVLTGVTGADPSFQSPAVSSITITGNSGGGLTGNSFTFTGGTTGLTFAGAGSTETLGGTLAIANGGTNATSMATSNGTIYYDGTRLVTTATGSAGQVLTSNGASAPTYQAAVTGITTIDGDIGSVTGSTIKFSGVNSGDSVIFNDDGTSDTMYLELTNSHNSTYLGSNAGGVGGTGANNVSIGFNSLQNQGSNARSISIGNGTIGASDTVDCVAIGHNALGNSDTGSSYNIAIGSNAGSTYGLGEASNICIGYNVVGTASESNVCRIGVGTGTGNGQLNATFIQGISGTNVGSVADVVSIATGTGKLGTTAITAGTGITITPGANTITIASATQSAFIAVLSATTGGSTGAGAPFTIVFDTSINDALGDYDTGTGIFTAPATGYYQFYTTITGITTTIATSMQIDIITTVNTFSNTFRRSAGNLDITLNLSIIAHMTAGDTAYCSVTIFGEAGNTDRIFGDNTTAGTVFGGAKIS